MNKVKEILLINFIPVLFIMAICIYHFGWPLPLYFILEVPVFILVTLDMMFNYKKYINPITVILTISLFITVGVTLVYDRNDIHLSNLFDGPHVRALNSHMLIFIAYYIKANYAEKSIKVIQSLSVIILASIVYAYVDFIKIGIGPTIRSQGFFENPIPASTIWLMGMWMPLYLKSKKIEFIIKIFYLPPIFFSLERNAWLGLVFVLFVAIIKFRKEITEQIRKIKKYIFVIFGILVSLFVYLLRGIIYDIFLLRLGNLFETKGVSDRIEYFKYGIESLNKLSLWDILFGQGWDYSRDMLLESEVYHEGFPMFDNTYLTVIYEYGLFRIILIICIFIITYLLLKNDIKPLYSMPLVACLVPSFFYDINLCITPMILVSSGIGFVLVQFNQMKKSDKQKNKRIENDK